MALPFTARLAAVLVTALGTCATAASGREWSANDGKSLLLPGDFRQELAAYLAEDYIRERIGPATISNVWNGKVPPGASRPVLIRYPVEGGMRCFKVETERGIGRDGRYRFGLTRLSPDAEECRAQERTIPYVELDRMAERLETCRANGQDRCVPGTTMPEARTPRPVNGR